MYRRKLTGVGTIDFFMNMIFDSNIECHFGSKVFHSFKNLRGFLMCYIRKNCPQNTCRYSMMFSYLWLQVFARVQATQTQNIYSDVSKYVEWWSGVSRFSTLTDGSWHAAARITPPKTLCQI